jgi:hypothetical protein
LFHSGTVFARALLDLQFQLPDPDLVQFRLGLRQLDKRIRAVRGISGSSCTISVARSQVPRRALQVSSGEPRA